MDGGRKTRQITVTVTDKSTQSWWLCHTHVVEAPSEEAWGKPWALGPSTGHGLYASAPPHHALLPPADHVQSHFAPKAELDRCFPLHTQS